MDRKLNKMTAVDGIIKGYEVLGKLQAAVQDKDYKTDHRSWKLQHYLMAKDYKERFLTKENKERVFEIPYKIIEDIYKYLILNGYNKHMYINNACYTHAVRSTMSYLDYGKTVHSKERRELIERSDEFLLHACVEFYFFISSAYAYLYDIEALEESLKEYKKNTPFFRRVWDYIRSY